MGTGLLILCKDLLFSSRITSAAKAANIPYALLRDPAQLAAQPAGKLILDLNLPGAIEAASSWRQATQGQTVGFVSHVDTPTIEKARAAGIQLILPRSQFVQNLAQLVESPPID